MNTHINARCAQAGSFLLEALIGILIFSFGILGIVGLQAQSLRHTGESEYRAEAVYLANSLVSQMWADNPPVPIAAATYLHDKYDSTAGGAGYVAFKNTVGGASGVAGLPGVILAQQRQPAGRAGGFGHRLQGQQRPAGPVDAESRRDRLRVLAGARRHRHPQLHDDRRRRRQCVLDDPNMATIPFAAGSTASA